MPQFVATHPGIEVIGQTAMTILHGMGPFSNTGLNILGRCGIVDLQPDVWYPQQAWLDAFRAIAQEVGDDLLYSIGHKIPLHAIWPSDIIGIPAALKSIDVAYHLNHRYKGKVLFDAETGTMMDLIGHYNVAKIQGSQVEIICNNPYPCHFDRGIVTATAQVYKPESVRFVSVTHDSESPCRNKGGESCKYIVNW